MPVEAQRAGEEVLVLAQVVALRRSEPLACGDRRRVPGGKSRAACGQLLDGAGLVLRGEARAGRDLEALRRPPVGLAEGRIAVGGRIRVGVDAESIERAGGYARRKVSARV